MTAGGELTTGGLVLLFLDGVGLGDPDPALNPVTAARTPVIAELLGGQLDRATAEVTQGGVVFRHLDTTMGYEGLPQSATGQTAILTGSNAAAAMDRHYGPWPGPTLRRLLEDESTLFDIGIEAGGAALANAYPPGYFAALTRRRHRPNAVAFAATSGGLQLKTLADYGRGEAVAADLSGDHFAALDDGLERAGLRGSAGALAAVARSNAFTMLDLWLTDHFGHQRAHEAGRSLMERFDTFLGALLQGGDDLRDDGYTLLLTSDHGNLEDLSTTGHTRNDVPLLAIGPRAGEFAAATCLTDIAPAAARVIRSRG